MKAKARHKRAVARILERERKNYKPPIVTARPLTRVIRYNTIEDERDFLDPKYTEYMLGVTTRELAKQIIENNCDLLRIVKHPDYVPSRTVVTVELEIVVPRPEPMYYDYDERGEISPCYNDEKLSTWTNRSI